jgi:hypothetical protein
MNVLALFQWGRRSPEGRRAYDARKKYEYRNRRADGSERVEIWISDPAVWRLICEAEENSSLAKITEQHVGEACRQFKRERAEAELAMVSRIRVGAVDREPHPPRDCYLIKRNRLGVEPVLMVDEQEQVWWDEDLAEPEEDNNPRGTGGGKRVVTTRRDG